MKRREFLKASLNVFCALGAGAVGFAAAREEKRKHPNILYILVDDLGYADLSVHGQKAFSTPNIDSIFRDGVRFTNGYVSNSVCAPSRAGLMTGREGSRFGFEANIPPRTEHGLDVGQKTIPDYLKLAGYKSYCIGKWHLGGPAQFHPNKRGFDEFTGIIGGSRTYFRSKAHDSEKSLQVNGRFIEEPEDLYVTDYLTDRAIEYIEDHSKKEPQQPWFMYMSYTAPHGPLEPKPGIMSRVGASIKDEKRRKYAGLVLNLDDNVGRLLNCLAKLRIDNDTMVIFMSDNGGPLNIGTSNSPLKGGKGSLWEGGVRVPYAIKWPARIPAGQVVDGPAISLDLLPTFAAITGVDRKSEILTDGINLMPHISGGRAPIPERTFHWRRGSKMQIGLRKGRWKVIGNRNTQEFSLYDLEADIREQNDVKPGNKELLEELQTLYSEWEGQVMDPVFHSNWKPRKRK